MHRTPLFQKTRGRARATDTSKADWHHHAMVVSTIIASLGVAPERRLEALDSFANGTHHILGHVSSSYSGTLVPCFSNASPCLHHLEEWFVSHLGAPQFKRSLRIHMALAIPNGLTDSIRFDSTDSIRSNKSNRIESIESNQSNEWNQHGGYSRGSKKKRIRFFERAHTQAQVEILFRTEPIESRGSRRISKGIKSIYHGRGIDPSR